MDFINCILFLLFVSTASYCQNINLRPKQHIDADKTALRFRGNDSSEPEYFKLLERDGQFLMVGARNAVYNISLKSLKIEQKIEWPSSEQHVNECKMKGKSSEDCHNYIRVMIKQSNSKSLICGTNAFKPTCRQYEHSTGHGHLMIREFNGYAISPYDPRDNSTALYLADTDELYAGTVSDFAATDPLIYRRPLSDMTSELRTQRNDLKCLNDPNFVSSFDDEDHVYFWFRETAAEHNGGASGPSRDKAVFGRIARVCKRDRGGPGSFSDTWTSFVKARLNCSLPGNIPFYFNELQATSAPIYTTDGSQLVYALMSTPPGPLQMSAVCAFRMEDVRRIFEFGQFKSQKDSRSLWLPVAKNKQPKIRPSCHSNSQTLSEEVTGFVMRNSLMADAVPNFFNAPLFVDNSMRTKYSQIAVHPQVQAASGRRFDVVFLGTDDGRVVKIVNIADGRSAKTILIETVKVFGLLEPVRNLLIDTKSLEEGRLIAVSKEEVRSISLHHCNNQLACSSCVRLRDPYCGWDMENAKCVGRINGDWTGDFVQNVLTGRSNLCPEGDLDPELYVVNELYPQHVAAAPVGIYSAESMAIAIIATLALASLIGVVIGYRLSRWKMQQDGLSTASNSDYDSHSLGRSRLTHHDAMAKLEHVYHAHPNTKLTNNEPVNMVLSLPGQIYPNYCSNTLKPDKNFQRTLNNGTLPKDYKVKKVYL